MEEALFPAVSALADAESRLRDAAAKAAAVGAYDSLALITRWAKTVQILASEANGSSNSSSLANPPALAPNTPGETPNDVGHATRKGRIRNSSRFAPAYARDANFLVKTARSRKSRAEYEHRAPAEVIFVVADCLSEWRSTKKLLTAEQLLAAYSHRKGTVVSYQIYVTLGWLIHSGLIRRHGRSGYSVPSPNTLAADVKKAWAALGSDANA